MRFIKKMKDNDLSHKLINNILIQIKQSIININNNTDKTCKIEWIPGHSDIQGNIIAHNLAVYAAKNSTLSSTGDLPPGLSGVRPRFSP